VNAAEQSFAEQLARAPDSEPGFVRALRQAGRHAFLRVKLPTTRHEDWRFTSLAGLAAEPWRAAPRAAAAADDLPPAPRLRAFRVADLVLAFVAGAAAARVNGRLEASLTDLAGLAAGVHAGSLAAALREEPGLVEAHLGRQAGPREHAFSALNAALFEDGALVEIADGARPERPVHVVHVSRPDGAPSASHPRTLVLAGDGARAAVVESFRGEGRYLVNALTEIAVGADAEVEHDHLQEEAVDAYHVALVHVAQRARSKFTGGSVALGAALGRVEARAVLADEGASCELDGLYVAQGRQLLDHLVHVDHARPRCTSRQMYKGILDDSARGVFAGRILVRQDAQKTDAAQVNSNLLLSDDAAIDTKPQLEILADDVKCSHGGAVGQIREDHLFYLRSRGISQALARALLTWAFASEMVQKVGPADVRRRVRAAVTARLPGGALLEEAA
jgi:Fe-S cluster assembly protein SufD